MNTDFPEIEIKPESFFTAKGQPLYVDMARTILKRRQRLATGPDDSLWSYQGGVWARDKYAVRGHLVRLLRDKYRKTHVSHVEDTVKETTPYIDAVPVPEWLNTKNGLLDWRTGQLKDHTPEVLSTVQFPVTWDESATCPGFDRFVAEIMAPDDVERIWELTAYLLYSGNPFHRAYLLCGTGANGKSVLMGVWRKLLGEQNVTSISLASLAGNRFATARLHGVTANLCGDIDGTWLPDTSTFKALTGQDQITAEHKGKDSFEFVPWAVPVFSCNRIPASADVSDGYLRRWEVVNFPNSFKGRENRNLLGELTAELPGILTAAASRLPALMDRGEFVRTASGRAASAEFARRTDPVRYWLDTCTSLVPAWHDDYRFVSRSALYGAYERWCLRDGCKAVRASEFHERVQRATGLAAGMSAGTSGYRGLVITDDARLFSMM